MGTVRIWVATDEEIRTCNIAPGHVELLFPKGSEQRRVTDMPELEKRIQRIGAQAVGLNPIEGAPDPCFTISAPALHALVQAASKRVRDPLVELFDPIGSTPEGADWTRQLVGLAKAAIENRCGLIFVINLGYF
jgi:hypothetical protein